MPNRLDRRQMIALTTAALGASLLPATRMAVFVNAIPVVSLLAAFMILGERLTAPQLLGAALVLAGVYLANGLKGSRKTLSGGAGQLKADAQDPILKPR